jgi:hypothetical protein
MDVSPAVYSAPQAWEGAYRRGIEIAPLCRLATIIAALSDNGGELEA